MGLVWGVAVTLIGNKVQKNLDAAETAGVPTSVDKKVNIEKNR